MAKDSVTKKSINTASSARVDESLGDFNPNDVKATKALILPPLKLIEGEHVYARIDTPMEQGKRVIDDDEKDRSGGKRPPATICNVTNLVDKKRYVMVCPKLIQGSLNDNYPDASYVGKCFHIFKGPKKHGKNGDYSTFEIDEIEPPTK